MSGVDPPVRSLSSILSRLRSLSDDISAKLTYGVGYDCEAYRFQGSEGGWQITGSLESKGRPGLGAEREESAFNMFKQMDLKGKTKDDTQLKTVHQNTISTIRVFEGSGTSKFHLYPECPLTPRPVTCFANAAFFLLRRVSLDFNSLQLPDSTLLTIALAGAVKKFSSKSSIQLSSREQIANRSLASGVDGRIVIWNA